MEHMPFTIEEAFLPATLTSPPMTDEQFAEFCAGHPDYFIEMTAEGEIIVMPPNYTITGFRNQEIAMQLGIWARMDGRGKCSESSTGFVLPNGARRSPDAAWTAKSRIQAIDREDEDRYWHFCPDFVIELRSRTDRLKVLRAKMREWIRNGAQLGWLIDPSRRVVEVYRAGREPETFVDAQRIEGEGPVAGFVLELGPVWDPLGEPISAGFAPGEN
jgi:Uma2 family endonuclease